MIFTPFNISNADWNYKAYTCIHLFLKDLLLLLLSKYSDTNKSKSFKKTVHSFSNSL